MSDSNERLLREAERIRASGALGRSEPIILLFNYLLEHITDDRAPKEIEVAQDVFQRTGAFEPSQDTAVRVTMHRLRRKLEQFYREDGADSAEQISIPKGQYRLVLASIRKANETEDLKLPVNRWPWLALACGIFIVIVASILRFGPLMVGGEISRFGSTPSLIPSSESKVLAIGAGYVYGERDTDKKMLRIVREFGVNSFSEIPAMQKNTAGDLNHIDIGNSYLSFAIANALTKIFPMLLASDTAHQLTVLPAVELSSELVRHNDVIYVGRFNDLGPLAMPVASRSGFTFDVHDNALVDRATKRRYVSDLFAGRSKGTRDFAYIMSFPAWNDHHVLILAGLSDGGITKASEAAISPSIIKTIREQVGDGNAFEVLIATESYRDEGMGGRVVVARKIPTLGRYKFQ